MTYTYREILGSLRPWASEYSEKEYSDALFLVGQWTDENGNRAVSFPDAAPLSGYDPEREYILDDLLFRNGL